MMNLSFSDAPRTNDQSELLALFSNFAETPFAEKLVGYWGKQAGRLPGSSNRKTRNNRETN
jgi:hypothetical protein